NAGETYATGLPLLVSDRDDGLAIVDYESGEVVQNITDANGQEIGISGDGRIAAVQSRISASDRLNVYDVATGEELLEERESTFDGSIRNPLANGNVVVAAGADTVIGFGVTPGDPDASGDQIWSTGHGTGELAKSPDETMVAFCSGMDLYILDFETGDELHVVEGFTDDHPRGIDFG
ncbi:hypothetical protein C482_00015, partial [Natrialba chahannaoensis JCM 10990]